MSALSEALREAKLSRNDESIYAIENRARTAGHPISPAAVARYLTDEGARHPPEQTIRGLAAGFLIPEQRIRELLDMPAGEPGPWVPTEEAVKLNRTQRAALDQLIKAIVKIDEHEHEPALDGRQSTSVMAPNPTHVVNGDEINTLGGWGRTGDPLDDSGRESDNAHVDAGAPERAGPPKP